MVCVMRRSSSHTGADVRTFMRRRPWLCFFPPVDRDVSRERNMVRIILRSVAVVQRCVYSVPCHAEAFPLARQTYWLIRLSKA